jgi:hypothetical protein
MNNEVAVPEKIVTGNCAHERHVQVSVWINPSWQHKHATSIYNMVMFQRLLDVGPNFHDEAISDQDVCPKLPVVIHHRSPL